MVYQEKMRSDGAASAAMPSKAIARTLSDLTQDLMTLVELQSKLLGEDLKESARGIATTGALVALGAALGLGCFPVLLAGIAYFLVMAGMAQAWAFLVTAVGGLILAGVLAYAGWRRLQSSLKSFDRSRYELRHSLVWIKESVRQTAADGAGTHQPEAGAGRRF